MSLIHVLAVGFVFALILIADKEAMLWMRGTREHLDARFLGTIHLFIWAGLAVLIMTGVVLLYPIRAFFLTEPLFITKMLFVAILLVNGVLIGRLHTVASRRTFASLSLGERAQLLVSGAFSVGAWTGAFVVGIVLFH